MSRSVALITLIYLVVSLAWFVLAGTISVRTGQTDRALTNAVADLWGEPQQQQAPELILVWKTVKKIEKQVKDPVTGKFRIETIEQPETLTESVDLDSSLINVDLALDHRKKGLLWYATYAVDFSGSYSYNHQNDREGMLEIVYRFPTTRASYDDFMFQIDGRPSKGTPGIEDGARVVRRRIPITKGQIVHFEVAYRSRGMTHWRYHFGNTVSNIRNFRMEMETDFRQIDFPAGTIAPDTKHATDSGWTLAWDFKNLVSGYAIGMGMPAKMNPGPLAQQMSFFAPVCLGFFFVWIFLITLFKGVEIHPMNYLFLAAAFFAFHLLFTYSVDHISLVPAFVISSVVSVFLVVSYLRLVVGTRFAFLEAGSAQVLYLVLFSYAHFFEGLTGLIITIGSILTLFAIMQFTGRTRWKVVFEKAGKNDVPPDSSLLTP